MSEVALKSREFRGNQLEKSGSSHPAVYYLLLGALLSTWIPVFCLTLNSALAATLALFLGVVFLGLWLCKRTVIRTRDSRLALLPIFWVLKVYLTLGCLYLGWMPDLDPATSRAWGYDPQRYYEYAWDLLQQGFHPEGLEQNYQGVLYYYALVFGLFGRNPVIPALWNSFITLAVVVLVIRITLSFPKTRSPRDWILAGLLLIPGLLWHDALTSKESILSPLLCLPPLLLAGHFQHPKQVSLPAALLVWTGVSLVVALVRTTVLLPLAISGVLLTMLVRSRQEKGLATGFALFGIMCVVVLMGPWLLSITGGYDFNFLVVISGATKTEDSLLLEEWNDRSLGQMLLPNTPAEAVVYLPFRAVLMLVTPFPVLGFTVEGLTKGYWSDWLRLTSALDSVVLMAGFPLVVGATVLAWRSRRKNPFLLVWPIVFWPLFLSVVGGLTILQERYRVIFLIPFYACAWLGFTRVEPRKKLILYGLWFGVLACGYLFYLLYKRML